MQTASDAEKIDHTDKKKQNKTKQKTTKKTPTAKLESRNAANRLRTTKDL